MNRMSVRRAADAFRLLLTAALVPISGLALATGASAVTALPLGAPCAAATFTGHVTLVVEHGGGGVTGLCIGFDGATITGEQILQASGLRYAVQSYGALGDAVCQIDGEPATYGTCLPSTGSFWAMFVSRGGGGWQNADRGMSTETFSDGDAEGFRYDDQSGAEPPPSSPAGICARALATANPGGGPAATAPPAQGAAGTSNAAPAQDATGSAPRQAPTAAGASNQAPTAVGAAPLANAAPSSNASSSASGSTPAPALVTPFATSGPNAVAASPPGLARATGGVNAAVLLACVAAGGLAGLAAVRLVRRRGT